MKAALSPSYGHAMTTIASDWDDVGAAVDYIRALRRVERVSLVAWSLGGPRAGGYAARDPQKVNRLVLLAPAYARGASATAPAQVPAPGAAFNTQSRADFDAQLGRQVACPNQVDPAAADSRVVGDAAVRSGRRHLGPGRAPRAADDHVGLGHGHRGQDADADADRPGHARQAGLPPCAPRSCTPISGAPQKVLVDLGCASHNAMWESNHLLLFRASLEWLTSGTVNGARTAR